MPIGEPMENYLQVFNRFFTRLKNIFLAERGPCSSVALGQGLAGLCLKTALALVGLLRDLIFNKSCNIWFSYKVDFGLSVLKL